MPITRSSPRLLTNAEAASHDDFARVVAKWSPMFDQAAAEYQAREFAPRDEPGGLAQAAQNAVADPRARLVTNLARAQGSVPTIEQKEAMFPGHTRAIQKDVERAQAADQATKQAQRSESRKGMGLIPRVALGLAGGTADIVAGVPAAAGAFVARRVGADDLASGLESTAAGLDEAGALPPAETFAGKVVNAVSQTAPQLVVGGLASLGAKTVKGALAVFAGTQAAPVVGQSYLGEKQRLINGGVDPDEAEHLAGIKAVTDGTITAVTSYLLPPIARVGPVGQALERWLGTKVGTEAMRQTAGKYLTRFGIPGAASEATQESVEYALQELATAGITDPALPPELRVAFQDGWQQLALNALTGGIVGGMADAAIHNFSKTLKPNVPADRAAPALDGVSTVGAPEIPTAQGQVQSGEPPVGEPGASLPAPVVEDADLADVTAESAALASMLEQPEGVSDGQTSAPAETPAAPAVPVVVPEAAQEADAQTGVVARDGLEPDVPAPVGESAGVQPVVASTPTDSGDARPDAPPVALVGQVMPGEAAPAVEPVVAPAENVGPALGFDIDIQPEDLPDSAFADVPKAEALKATIAKGLQALKSKSIDGRKRSKSHLDTIRQAVYAARSELAGMARTDVPPNTPAVGGLTNTPEMTAPVDSPVVSTEATATETPEPDKYEKAAGWAKDGRRRVLQNRMERGEVVPPSLLVEFAGEEWAKDAAKAGIEAMVEQTAKPTVRRDFELTESEYVNKHLARDIRKYERGIETAKAERARINPRAYKAIADKDSAIRLWTMQLERLRAAERGDAAEAAEAKRLEVRKIYVDVVRKAISTGQPVPPEIIAQRKEFASARDARARYDKGRHTSFANKSIAVDSTMQGERGYKVKRQDGTAITQDQRDIIGKAVADVEEAIGPLADLLRHSDLTISHTNGRFPFMDGTAGGLYHTVDRTISYGTQIGPFLQRALAHEMGHWLDFEAGKARGASARVVNSSGRGRTVTSLSEAAAQDKHSPERALIEAATRTINGAWEVRKILTAKTDKMTEAEKQENAAQKFMLTPYWRSPREVWARLFEQYVGTKLNRGGHGHETPQQYGKAVGWWTPEEFAKLAPQVEALIADKVEALRQSIPKAEAAPAVSAAAPTLADRLESEARARLKSRTIKRGKGTGATSLPGDLVDVAIIAAARAWKAGAKSIAAVRAIVEKVAREMGRTLSDHDARRVTNAAQKVAYKTLRAESVNSDENDAASVFEAEVARLQGQDAPAVPSAKKAIREANGLAPDGPTVSESDALAATMKAKESASAEAFKAGRSEANEEAAAKVAVLRADLLLASKATGQAYKLGAVDADGRARTRAQAIQSIKDQIVDLASVLPADKRARFMTFVRDAQTVKQLEAARLLIDDTLARSQAKDAHGRIDAVTGKEDLRRLRNEAQQGEDVSPRRAAEQLHADAQATWGAFKRGEIKAREAADRLAQTADVLEQLAYEAKVENTLIRDDRRDSAEAARNKVVLAAQTRPELDPARADRNPWFGTRLWRWAMNTTTFAKVLDNWRGGQQGTAGRMLDTEMFEARRRVAETTREMMDKLDAAVRRAGYEGVGDWAAKWHGTLGRSNQLFTDVKIKGRKDPLSFGEAAGLVAMDPMQRANVLDGIEMSIGEELAESHPVTATDLENALDALPRKDQRLVREIKDIIQSKRQALDSLRRRMHGVGLQIVPDYYPSFRNMRLADGHSVPMSYRTAAAAHYENAGMLQERTGGKTPYRLPNVVPTVLNYIDSTAKILHLSEPIRNAEVVFLHPKVKQAVARHFGKAGMERVSETIVDASMKRPLADVTAFTKFIEEMSHNSSRSKVQVNPWTWLRQLTGISTAASQIDARYWAAGMKAAANSKVQAKIEEADPWFWVRWRASPYALQIATNESATLDPGSESLGRPLRAAGHAARKGDVRGVYRAALQAQDAIRIGNWFDAAPARFLWGAFEAQARAEHADWDPETRIRWVSEQTARAFRATQNTTGAGEDSAATRSLRGNIYTRPLAAFKADTVKKLNMLQQAGMQGPKELSRVALHIAVGMAGSASIAYLAAVALDDEEKALNAAGRRFIRETASLFPLGESVLSVVDAGLRDGRGLNMGDIVGAPLYDDALRVLNGAIKLKAAIEKADAHQTGATTTAARKFQRALEDLLGGAAGLTGLSVEPAYRAAVKPRLDAATDNPRNARD